MKEVLEIDDASLVRECRRGDREAMSLLYTRHAPRMLRLISRYVKDPDDAKDILHDGFIVAFTRLDTLHEPGKADHWLATIMKNLSLKFLQEQSVVSILDEIPEEAGDDGEIYDLLDFETLEKLISRLPDGYQKVFRLAVLENKSHKEIARILGIAPNSSSSQLFHAKVLLRKLIEEYKKKGGALVLLLIAVTGSLLYLRKDYNESTSSRQPASETRNYARLPKMISEETNHYPEQQRSLISEGTIHYAEVKAIPESIPTSPSIPDEQEERQSGIAASEPEETPCGTPAAKEDKAIQNHFMQNNDLYSDHYAGNQVKTSGNHGWSAGISVDPGIFNFENKSIEDLADMPSIKDHLRGQHHKNLLPLGVAITAEKRLTSRLGVETGISYTYLQSDFESDNTRTRCRWHYIGIPLKVNLYAYSSPHFRIYASAGGGIAIPAYSNSKILWQRVPFYRDGKFSSPAVLWVGGSIGISVPLSRKIEVYVEPTVRYNFPHSYEVPNAWTDDPWNVSVPIGVRFKW